jgi:zinc transporter, ZIP family
MNIILAVIAGIGFTLAGLAGLLGVTIGRPIRALAVAIASGILLAISFAELFPEAIEVAGHEAAVAGFLAGFVVLFLVEVATRGHTHHDEADASDHAHGHALWPFLVGLALHNLTDGFAIGASSELSDETAGAVAIGVLIHQIPVGVSFAAVLAAASRSRTFVARSALALGGAIALGALIQTALPPMEEATMATMGAAAAGALAYIGAGHLLPEAHKERASVAVAIAFPASLLLTTLLFLRVLAHD